MNSKKWLFVFYKFCIGLGIGVIFTAIYMLIHFRFHLIDFTSGFFLTSFLLAIVGLSSFVANQGFFDMIAYGFSTIPFMLHIQSDRKYEDLVAYKEAKEIKRTDMNFSWLGYEFSALLFLIISLILYTILKLI